MVHNTIKTGIYDCIPWVTVSSTPIIGWRERSGGFTSSGCRNLLLSLVCQTFLWPCDGGNEINRICQEIHLDTLSFPYLTMSAQKGVAFVWEKRFISDILVSENESKDCVEGVLGMGLWRKSRCEWMLRVLKSRLKWSSYAYHRKFRFTHGYVIDRIDHRNDRTWHWSPFGAFHWGSQRKSMARSAADTHIESHQKRAHRRWVKWQTKWGYGTS